MIMCMNEHSCCAPCLQELLKTEGNKPLACPHCQQPVNKKLITKNRHLMTIFELITAYKKYAGTL
jgi:DNA-directed RNA polymerase subunit RPC12/RpoP